MWKKILTNIVTLGIPAIIDAIAKNRRKKRAQEAKLKREKMKNEKIDND